MTEVFIAQGDTGEAAAPRAMAAAFAARGIPEQPQIARTVLGKPYLTDYPGVLFNLSHSGHYGVCAISGAPVGVDVEMIRPLRRDLARRFFAKAEQQWLERNPPEEFFRLWTRKESFTKALGKGITMKLDSFSVLEEVLYHDGAVWYFSEFPVEGGYLTVCAQEFEVKFHVL